METNSMYVTIVQHCSKLPLLPSTGTIIPIVLYTLQVKFNVFISNWESFYAVSFLGTNQKLHQLKRVC